MDVLRDFIKNGKYNILWMLTGLIGFLVMTLGVFGVIGLLGIPAPGAVFAAGIILIAIPAAVVFYNSYRLGLFSDTEVETENKKRISHHKRKR